MSALYLLAGAVREAGGSFSLHDVSGLYGRLPLLAAIGFVLVLAAAGLPPASGLWPKIVLVRAALAAGMPWMAAVILLCAFITTIALGRLFILVFWREGAGNPEEVRPLTTGTYLPLVALTLPILLLGLYPQPALELAQGASRLLLSPAPYLDAVFPGAR
jgi:multicomponent Na+:H+ antiporter subunit D